MSQRNSTEIYTHHKWTLELEHMQAKEDQKQDT